MCVSVRILYRLAQLMKSVKKQTARESHTDDVLELSIDQAAAVESEISNWLSDLPPRYRLDMSTTDPSHHHHHYSAGSGPSSSTPPMLISQRCELVMIANRMILKLYLPFLRDANGHGPNKPSHQAVLGTINAAHCISHAARVLHSACQETRPALFDYYDFGRALFDAAIVCAHATMQQPTSILATEAMKCVDDALEIMREWGTFKYAADGSSEGLRIIELMKQKAEIARGTLNDDGSGNSGTKRKRTEFEDDTLDDGFQLPFIGTSVTSVRTDQAKPVLIPSRPAVPSSKDSSGKSSKEKARYPAVGIRNRPGQVRPTNRQRTGSIPPSPVDGVHPHTVTTTLVEPQIVGHHPQRQTQPAVGTTMGVPEASMSSLPFSTHTPPAEPPQANPAAVQQNAFNPGFATHEEAQFVDQRRFSHNSSGQSGGFEQHTASSSPYSPTHQHLPYHAPQSNEGYYMPYTGPGGPQQMYDAASGVAPHPQDMSMPDYAPHGPSATLETPAPNAPHDQQSYGIPHERHPSSTYPAYMQKADIAPAPTPYQQSANHAMQVNPINGWVHANPSNPEMWTSHPKYMHGMGSG